MKSQKRCGAKKKDGNPCRTWAMANGRCRIHGGTSLKGIESGPYKHGGYAKGLPKEAQADIQARAEDSDLIANRGLIALMDHRIELLMDLVGSGGMPPGNPFRKHGSSWNVESVTGTRNCRQMVSGDWGRSLTTALGLKRPGSTSTR